MDKSLTCCFTGHRPKDLWGYYQSANAHYDNLVNYLESTILPHLYEQGYRSFISGGAQGFDQLVFEAVHHFKQTHPDIENVIYAPCRNQDKQWFDGMNRFCRGYYNRLLTLADRVEYVTNTEYTLTCMNARNEAMINDSNCVVALFNGDITKARKSQSGTENTITMAVNQDAYSIYQLFYNLNDSSWYSFQTYTSDEIKRASMPKWSYSEEDNSLYINSNPVPALPQNGFGDVICLDTETTGFSYETFDELLQLALVGINGEEYMTYIKPDKKKNWAGAEKVNGISPAMVENSPSARNVITAIQPFIDKARILVGHNIAFDLNFLKKAGLQIPDSVAVWDTCEYFKNDIPEGRHKLGNAVETYCPNIIEEYLNGAHDALTDTRATMKVYKSQRQKEQDKLDTLFYER